MYKGLALSFCMCALVGACSNGGGNSDGGSDATFEAGPTVCSGDFDCPSIGDHCYFLLNGGCTLQGNKGVCKNYVAPANCTPNVGCGCDGTTINVCAPPNYGDRPSQTAGACAAPDGGPEAGTDGATDAGSD